MVPIHLPLHETNLPVYAESPPTTRASIHGLFSSIMFQPRRCPVRSGMHRASITLSERKEYKGQLDAVQRISHLGFVLDTTRMVFGITKERFDNLEGLSR